MKAKDVKKLLKRGKGSYIPFAIILVLLILAFFAETSFNFSFAFDGYDAVPDRQSAMYVPNSSDIQIIFSNFFINDSAKEVDYTIYISAWLDFNVTEIVVQLQTYFSYEHFVLNNEGRASYGSSPWGWYYQINETKVIHEKLAGFSQGYPYDYYSIPINLIFYTGGWNATFDKDFKPSISLPVVLGWNTESYSKPISSNSLGISLNAGIVVHRDAVAAVLQFILPAIGLYSLMGCYLFVDRKNRLSLGLTIGVITLSLYTFLLRQFDWIPAFVQNIAVSLVVSNIVLLVFSIVSFEWISERRKLAVMTLASVIPIFYFLFSAIDFMSSSFHYINANLGVWFQIFLSQYVDYRFLFWFTIFQLVFWALYLHKQKTLFVMTGVVGVGMFFLNLLKVGFSQDHTFTAIGFILLFLALAFSAGSLFKNKPKKESYISSDFDY